MEFLEELLLTALISILLALLLGNIAAQRPGSVPASANLGLFQGAGFDPIKEEEEKVEREGNPSRVTLGESDCAETKVFEAGDESLSDERSKKRLAREEDNIFFGEPEIGRIDGDKGENGVREVLEKIAGLGGERAAGKVDKEEVGAVHGGQGGSLLHGEDEWEGIEKSDVGKQFGVATEFVRSKKGGEAVAKLSSEVKMQLYGLHKVATEGPCHEPQPMALKVTARAKWQYWQRLGNMNPEDAMEQYIGLLTENIPEWTEEQSGEPDGDEPLVIDECKTSELNSKASHYRSETKRIVDGRRLLPYLLAKRDALNKECDSATRLPHGLMQNLHVHRLMIYRTDQDDSFQPDVTDKSDVVNSYATNGPFMHWKKLMLESRLF